ncbi:MAG: FtsX-like permease family protein, partial [Opitutaceae bacterium]|nr:FtsX-like permease family protein [Opitutaceae bacterium]
KRAWMAAVLVRRSSGRDLPIMGGVVGLGGVVVPMRVMAVFTVATGVIVLAGAVATGRFQRMRETVLLRTLGASRAQLVKIQLVEYAVLGLLGALVGGGLAYGAGAALAVWVFKAPVILPVLPLVSAVGAVMVLTLVTGWLSGRGITRHPPLEVLRQET